MPPQILQDDEVQKLLRSGRASLGQPMVGSEAVPQTSPSGADQFLGSVRRIGEGALAVVNTAARATLIPQLTGFATKTLGGVIGSGIGTVAGAVEAVKTGDASKVLEGTEIGRKATEQFGSVIGQAGATAALEYQFGGKVLNLLTAVPELVKGVQIAKGTEAPEVLGLKAPRSVAAGANIGLGLVGLYGAAQAPGWLPFAAEKLPLRAANALKRLRTSQLAPGVVTEISKDIPQFGPGAASKIEMRAEAAKNALYGYLDDAEKAKGDYSLPTPLEKAGDKAAEALKQIKETRSVFGDVKSEMAKAAGNKKVAGLDDVFERLASEMDDSLGLRISTTIETVDDVTRVVNKVVPAPDGAKVAAEDIPVIQKMVDEIAALGDESSVAKVDSLVDRLQATIYGPKQNTFYQPSDSIKRLEKSLTGELNQRLKDAVGGDFAAVNAYYAEMSDIYKHLNKAVGLGGSKGGSLMKRIFSPTDSGTKDLFRRVEALTGQDLVKEATLAKFAMEAVGDVRQRSLLESMDLLRPSANFQSWTAKAVKAIFDKIVANYLDPMQVAKDIASGKLKPGK